MSFFNFNADSDYAEIADSVGDALIVIQNHENALQDGLQPADILVALGSEKDVREIINDSPQALAELKKLSAATSRDAMLLAGKRVLDGGRRVGPVTRAIVNYIWGTVTGYGAVVDIMKIAIGQYDEKVALMQGQDIFPLFLEGAPKA